MLNNRGRSIWENPSDSSTSSLRIKFIRLVLSSRVLTTRISIYSLQIINHLSKSTVSISVNLSCSIITCPLWSHLLELPKQLLFLVPRIGDREESCEFFTIFHEVFVLCVFHSQRDSQRLMIMSADLLLSVFNRYPPKSDSSPRDLGGSLSRVG